MTSTRERQRAAARARLEKEMAERSARARKRRQTQAIVGGAAALLLVVAGTVWLVSSLTGDGSGTDNAAQDAATVQCDWVEIPADQRTPQTKDVGMPDTEQSRVGTQTMTIDTNLGPITAKFDRAGCTCTAASFTHLAEQELLRQHQVPPAGHRASRCCSAATRAPTARAGGTPTAPAARATGTAEENLPTENAAAVPGRRHRDGQPASPATTGSQFFIIYRRLPLQPGLHRCSAR